MDLELSGRAVLVTGGSRGIGAVTAAAFAAEQANVVIASRTKSDLESTAERIRASTGRSVTPVTMDVTDPKSVLAGVALTIEVFGHVDIVVSCAIDVVGGAPGAPSEITADALAQAFDVKVVGALHVIQAVLPLMRDRGWGRIITLGGGSARQVGGVTAGVRNAGIVALTKNIASEVASRGITANVIHPGGVLTERNQPRLDSIVQEERISPQEAEARMAGSIPLGRMIHSEDIANLALFLASPYADAITGQTISVDGGSGRAIVY